VTTGLCCNKHQIYPFIYWLVHQDRRQSSRGGRWKGCARYLAHISLPAHPPDLLRLRIHNRLVAWKFHIPTASDDHVVEVGTKHESFIGIDERVSSLLGYLQARFNVQHRITKGRVRISPSKTRNQLFPTIPYAHATMYHRLLPGMNVDFFSVACRLPDIRTARKRCYICCRAAGVRLWEGGADVAM
jgi:hypothetical protein